MAKTTTARPQFKGTPMMRSLAAGMRSNTPTVLWGRPGVGKTAKVEKMGDSDGRHVETVIGSIREPADFLGLPIEVNGEVRYAPPAFAKRLNEAASGLLFLDELTTCAPSVQKAMLRILQERFVGDERLNDTVSIVCAANPPECAADGMDLAPPVANRLMHLDWHFDADEWLDNIATDFAHADQPSVDDMLGKRTDSERALAAGRVTAFLKHNVQHLNPAVPDDPEKAGKAWASPRSWHNVVKVLAELHPADEDAAMLVVKGLVGEGAAIEFFAFLATSDLRDPAEVLDDPSSVEWATERPDRLFVLTTSVTTLALMRGDKESWRKALMVMVAAAEGNKPDVAYPSVRTLGNARPEGAVLPEKVREAFAPMLMLTGSFKAA